MLSKINKNTTGILLKRIHSNFVYYIIELGKTTTVLLYLHNIMYYYIKRLLWHDASAVNTALEIFFLLYAFKSYQMIIPYHV